MEIQLIQRTTNNRNRKPEKFKIFKTLADGIAVLFFLLFLYAAASKLIDYGNFKLQISKSPILTDFAGILVWLVPAIEIIIAILLMIPRTLMIGLYASLALMCLFTAYIIAILNFSDSIPCSCGGILQRMSWTDHLIFNVVFLILAMISIFFLQKFNDHKIARS